MLVSAYVRYTGRYNFLSMGTYSELGY